MKVKIEIIPSERMFVVYSKERWYQQWECERTFIFYEGLFPVVDVTLYLRQQEQKRREAIIFAESLLEREVIWSKSK